MKFKLDIDGDIEAIMKDEKHRMGLAATAAIRFGGELVKLNWRKQVIAAGLGSRLANTIRHDAYPKKGFSYTPAGLIYSKADPIVDAFEHGSLITAKGGNWLAIPLPVVGRKRGGQKLTPAEWQRQTGKRLRFVHNRQTRSAFLVADDSRISTRTGLVRTKGGKRRKDGILSGAQTVPVFMLVPQAKMPKLLNLLVAAEQIADTLPYAIVERWTSARVR